MIRLSPSGPAVSPIVLGVMKWGVWGKRYDPEQMQALIGASIDLGVTTFDHADIYGHYTTEAEFGKALAQRPGLRQQIQLITKCGIRLVTPNRPDYRIKSYDTSKEHIIASAERSLTNLRTDYLDLLLIHRPSPLMDPGEVAEAFAALKASGKVLHFGVSNFSASQFELLQHHFPLVTNQVEASIMHLDPFLDGVFDGLMIRNVRPMAWAPFGGGQFFTDRADPRVSRIRAEAEAMKHEFGLEQIDPLILAWLLRHPSGIVPVIGTGRIERVQLALQALEITLTREQWFRLWSASTGKEVA